MSYQSQQSIIQAFFNGTPLDIGVFITPENLYERLDKGIEKYDLGVEYYYNQMVRMEQAVVDNCKGGVYGKKELLRTAESLGLESYESMSVIWFMNIRYLLKMGRIKDDDNYGFLIQQSKDMDGLLKLLKGCGKELRVASQVCIVCETPTKTLCQKCKKVYYCCRDHQVQDWKKHKKVCKAN